MAEQEIDNKLYIMEGVYINRDNIAQARARLENKIYEPELYAVAVSKDGFNSKFIFKSENIESLIDSLRLLSGKYEILIERAPGLEEEVFDGEDIEIYVPLAVDADREDIDKFKKSGIEYKVQKPRLDKV